MNRCEHYVCRCARARELLAMYDRTGHGRLLLQAVDVHYQTVECRVAGALLGLPVVIDPTMPRDRARLVRE